MERFDLKAPLKHNLMILKLSGLWPAGEGGHTPGLYTLYAAFCIVFLYIAHILLQTVNFFFIYDDLELLASSLYVVLQELSSVFKLGFFVKNLPTMKMLVKFLDSDMFQPRTSQQRKVLQELMDFWYNFFRMFGFSVSGTLVLWAIYPLMDASSKKNGLPFLAWYPFNPTSTPIYQLTYLHQMLGTSFAAYSTFCLDTLLAAIMMYIAGQCGTLCDDLRNIYDLAKDRLEMKTFDEDEEELILGEFNNSLKSCIAYHKTILRYADIFNEVLDPIAVTQFTTSLLAICLTMFQLTLITPLTSEFYSVILYQSSIMFQILTYCFFGNEVIIQSGNIPFAVYESDWTDSSLEFKKNMVFFISRTQKPIKLKTLDFFALSLETFTAIMRSSWSFFALLRQINGGSDQV